METTRIVKKVTEWEPCSSRPVGIPRLRWLDQVQGVQLKSGPYFNMRNLFTKIYNMLYYTTNLYLQ